MLIVEVTSYDFHLALLLMAILLNFWHSKAISSIKGEGIVWGLSEHGVIFLILAVLDSYDLLKWAILSSRKVLNVTSWFLVVL